MKFLESTNLQSFKISRQSAHCYRRFRDAMFLKTSLCHDLSLLFDGKNTGQTKACDSDSAPSSRPHGILFIDYFEKSQSIRPLHRQICALGNKNREKPYIKKKNE